MKIKTYGPIGYESACEIFRANETRVRERFPAFFMRDFERLEDSRIEPRDIQKICGGNAEFIAEIKEGGLFGALWEAGEALGCGLEVDLMKITIPQEVVEVLELFKESPYECSSAGSWLTVERENGAEKSARIPREREVDAEKSIQSSRECENNTGKSVHSSIELERAGEATDGEGMTGNIDIWKTGTEIGSMTARNSRIIKCLEGDRFLTPPTRQKQDIADRRSYK